MIASPNSCPEGSVATIETFRSIDDNEKGYHVETRNVQSSSYCDSSYMYRRVSTDDDGDDVTCFDANPSALPVIGDQPDISVTLNCESWTFCHFRWDIQFGCASTGVTFDSVDRGSYQVLSDIDDTITCSDPSGTCDSIPSCTFEGTVKEFVSGVDRRLEHKEMYPGVAELQLALALGHKNGDDGRDIPSKPILLSARPREAELFLAIDQDSELNTYFEEVGHRNDFKYWGVNVDSSMYGTILDGTDFTEIGQTKARSYLSLAKERPNTRFVFLGDNGQGDVCAAQSMLEVAAGGEGRKQQQMAAVLIHVVQDDPSRILTDCQTPDGTDFILDLPESDEVHYYRTHSDATTWCLEKGLISCNSATRVHDAVDEWYRCRCMGESCPPLGLPTGFATQTTKAETLDYCAEVETDQAVLGAELAACGDLAVSGVDE